MSSIEADLREVAEAVRARIADLSATIENETRQQVPEMHSKNDPALAEIEGPSIFSALVSIVDGLVGGRRAPDGASDAALREARVVAQAGIDLHSLLRTYRVGQAVLWEAILEETLRVIPSDERRVAVLKQASDYHYSWNNKVTESVIAAYQAEHDAYFFRSQDRKRRAIVSDVLRGVPTDTQRLGYNLRTEHLAVVAWGRSAEASIRLLAVGLDVRHLAVSGTSGTHLGWLGGTDLGRRLLERPEALKAPAEAHLALGEVGRAIEGFRLSHRQAWQAYRVGRLRSEAITRYSDVALESLMLRDHQAVRDFVARELGGLGDGDSRGDVLRETLKAYFRSGQNAASTAQAIHVHERTVAYRLRSIETRLGITLSSRRDELAVALRLEELLEASREGEDLIPDDGDSSIDPTL